MRHRATPGARCSRCYMPLVLCLCAEISPLMTRTRVTFIMHVAETRRSSGTARLAHLALTNSMVCVHGQLHQGLKLPDVENDGRSFVLFPSDSAPEISYDFVRTLTQPIHLIVPDGNWHQARRITQRVPEIRLLPRLRVPSNPPSRYKLRTAPHAGVLCTLEAVARALGLLERPEIGAELERLMNIMIERTLRVRSARRIKAT